MKTSPLGIAAIIRFEGFRSKAYRDIVGVLTIGYGFTKAVHPHDTMTREQADERLRTELDSYELAVMQATAGKVNQHQFDALVSLAWNIGIAGMKKSTVVKAHNRGDYQAAARAFGLWNKAGGKVIAGLTSRRALESVLYLKPIDDAAVEERQMPQAVDPETSMAQSGINQAGVVAGGTATVVAVTQTIDTINTLKTSVAGLGDWLIPIACAVVVIAVGYMIWQRVQQRRGGWA
jgi:lysozyme